MSAVISNVNDSRHNFVYKKGVQNRYPSLLEGQAIQRKTVGFSGVLSKTEDFTRWLQNLIPEKWMISLANKVSDKTINSKWLRKLADMAVNNNVLCEALLVLGVTSTLRPATIMVTPGAPKEDRIYSAARSVASGIANLVVITVFTMPLAWQMKKAGKVVSKCMESLSKSKNLGNLKFPEYDSPEYKALNFLLNNGTKFIIGIPEAMLLFKLVPPVVNFFFPKREKKKTDNDYVYIPAMSLNLTKERQDLFKDFVKQGGKK